jgi:hypothetical protein
MQTVNLNQVNTFCLKKNLLIKKANNRDVCSVLDRIICLHATTATTPYLSLWARMLNFQKTDLEQELFERKNLFRIRCMRKTMFILSKQWLVPAYAACNDLFTKRLNEYLRYRGLSHAEYNMYEELILKTLNGKSHTTTEIRKKVPAHIEVPFIISLLCDLGQMIRTHPLKGWKNQNWQYALFKDYAPEIDLKSIDEKQALLQLVNKYIEVFGPVTEKDIIWWSGINRTKIREVLSSISNEIEKISITGLDDVYLVMKAQLSELSNIEQQKLPCINLLPLLDPYPMAYKNRARYLEEEHIPYVFDRAGNITSCIFIDGIITGVWDCIEKPEPIVKLFFLIKIDSKTKQRIHEEALKLGEFITENTVKVIECSKMKPLNQRTYGSFMSPLK